MRNTCSELALSHKPWSHRQRLKGGGSTKLISISNIATWRVEMPHHRDAEKLNAGMPKRQKDKLQNSEISARPIIYDPTVQVIQEYDRRAIVSLHS
jgi:hypothetical protein